MKIRIFQINTERDTEHLAFAPFDTLSNQPNIDSSLYDMVFDDNIQAQSLEDVYRIFNLEQPAGYQGRSLSVSDIIEIYEDSKLESGFYFCDTVGFKKISFDPNQAKTLSEKTKTIRVVLVEPNKTAKITDIDASLSGMQKIVGGYIETFYPFDDEACIICNEEGKINGMPLNRAIYAEPKEIEMTYAELRDRFCQTESKGQHTSGYIVFTEDSFDRPYSELSRTYKVSSNNKAFQARMGGYSIYASCLDGSDPCVRLERYMASEHGGIDGWKIERCYIKEQEREIIEIISGPFFICDCSGENFGSLNKEQQKNYLELFRLPERFFFAQDKLTAIPYTPEHTKER